VNIKTLSAVAIVTAALAAPASAQYERVWGPRWKAMIRRRLWCCH